MSDLTLTFTKVKCEKYLSVSISRSINSKHLKCISKIHLRMYIVFKPKAMTLNLKIKVTAIFHGCLSASCFLLALLGTYLFYWAADYTQMLELKCWYYTSSYFCCSPWPWPSPRLNVQNTSVLITPRVWRANTWNFHQRLILEYTFFSDQSRWPWSKGSRSKPRFVDTIETLLSQSASDVASQLFTTSSSCMLPCVTQNFNALDTPQAILESNQKLIVD